MELLWPHLESAAAANQLYKSLHYLRAELARRDITTPVIVAGEELVELADAVRVDVDEFRARARAARERKDPALYEQALEVYAGDLLPEDVFEEWTDGPREEPRTLRLAPLLEVAGDGMAAMRVRGKAVLGHILGGKVAEAAQLLELTEAANALGDWQRGVGYELQRQQLAVEDGSNVDEALEAHLCLWEYHLYGDRPYSEVEASVRATLQRAESVGNVRAMALCQHALGSVLLLVVTGSCTRSRSRSSWPPVSWSGPSSPAPAPRSWPRPFAAGPAAPVPSTHAAGGRQA